MKSYTYQIRSPYLRPYIKFLLFNHASSQSTDSSVTYYPNTDICIGILHKKRLQQQNNILVALEHTKTIHSYIAGIYDTPLSFQTRGSFEEICLPFTPLGYHSFFTFPFKTFMFQDDILTELFGKNAKHLFEKFFHIKNPHLRGQKIEHFLLAKIPPKKDNFLTRSIQYFNSTAPGQPLKNLLEALNCSERKLQRTFRTHMDIAPKTYQQVLQFRLALWQMQSTKRSLTDIAYESGYFDQSHFIRSIKTFTGTNPSSLRNQVVNIDDRVICSFSK